MNAGDERKSLYYSDWSIEQAEANAPSGSRVRIVSGGVLNGLEGVVLRYELKCGAGSWGAEATVRVEGHPMLPLLAFVPQKLSASRLVRIDEVTS